MNAYQIDLINSAKVVVISDERSGRLRARTVDVGDLARSVAVDVIEKNKPSIRCRIGGTVCNSYGYSADTECAIAVAFPTYREEGGEQIVVAIYASQVPANKATRGGCAESCLTGTRPIWDKRYSSEAKEKAREYLINEAIKDLAKYAGLQLSHIKVLEG